MCCQRRICGAGGQPDPRDLLAEGKHVRLAARDAGVQFFIGRLKRLQLARNLKLCRKAGREVAHVRNRTWLLELACGGPRQLQKRRGQIDAVLLQLELGDVLALRIERARFFFRVLVSGLHNADQARVFLQPLLGFDLSPRNCLVKQPDRRLDELKTREDQPDRSDRLANTGQRADEGGRGAGRIGQRLVVGEHLREQLFKYLERDLAAALHVVVCSLAARADPAERVLNGLPGARGIVAQRIDGLRRVRGRLLGALRTAVDDQ